MHRRTLRAAGIAASVAVLAACQAAEQDTSTAGGTTDATSSSTPAGDAEGAPEGERGVVPADVCAVLTPSDVEAYVPSATRTSLEAGPLQPQGMCGYSNEDGGALGLYIGPAGDDWQPVVSGLMTATTDVQDVDELGDDAAATYDPGRPDSMIHVQWRRGGLAYSLSYASGYEPGDYRPQLIHLARRLDPG